MASISKGTAKRLREIWLDEIIIIYLKGMNVTTVNESGEEIKISAMCDGYVVDIDEEYFYLGLEDGTVMKTIHHDTIGIVELADFGSNEFFNDNVPRPDEEVH